MGGRTKAKVTPEVMQWAREQAKLSIEEASEKIRRPVEDLLGWEAGTVTPSIAQARKASEVYKRPLAVFFLPNPPEDFQTLRDFRSLDGIGLEDYSPELQLTIREAQYRQDWAREILIAEGSEELDFAGSATTEEDPRQLAKKIRDYLGITYEEQVESKNVTQAFKLWMLKAENIGVFVFRRRDINLFEARGFLLYDDLAPMVFVNSDDSKTGQIFTLAHELVHLWIGQGGISNMRRLASIRNDEIRRIEVFCNRVAANVILGGDKLAEEWESRLGSPDPDKFIVSTALKYRVSEEMIARRLLDANVISPEHYRELRHIYRERFEEVKENERKKWRESDSGPSYYRTTAPKLGYAFAKTIIAAYYSGSLSPRDASDALGVKVNNIKKLGEEVGMYGI